MCAALAETMAEWEELEERTEVANHELVAEDKRCEACLRLREVPDMGDADGNGAGSGGGGREGLREGARLGWA